MLGPKEYLGVGCKPGIGATGPNGINNPLIDGLIAQKIARVLMDKKGQRHTPCALARHHPIGATFNHAVNAIAPRRGQPCNAINRLQCRFPQMSVGHGNKPLRRIPENQRRFGAPAMGILVAQFTLGQQAIGGDQGLDHGRVGIPFFAIRFENRLTRE